MQTIPIESTSPLQREQAAAILVSALAHAPSGWHDMQSARAEVASFTADAERMAIAAVDGANLLGWIGSIRHSRTAWELHPLVIDPAHQLGDSAIRWSVCFRMSVVSAGMTS